MTPVPKIQDADHTAMNHRLYMAEYNRAAAHKYRRFYKIFGEQSGQFHWHMREAIRWIQVEKMERRADEQHLA